MQLNEEIWGTDVQQARQISNYSIGIYSIASTLLDTANTIGNYKENHGTSEPIDQSVNYWQLWDKSPFNKLLYIRKDGANNHIYTQVKSTKPKSIFVALRPTQVSDINFDINSQYTHLWEPEIAYPNSRTPYANYGDIITKFNYNQIGARFIPCVYRRDENGYPINGSVPDEYESIYGFFNLEENGIPVRDKYIITGLSVELFPLNETGQNGYNQNNVFYPVSSTPIENPQPNYYYQGNDYVAYTREQYIIGGLISGNGGYGYQIGAYGQSGHAPYWGYDPDNHWELKNFINSNSQYIEFFEFTGTYEDLLSQCASLGFWFREDLQPGSTIPSNLFPMATGRYCTDNKVIMPIIENGMTTGRYLRGEDAGNSAQAGWGSEWRDAVGYTGDKPYKGNDEDEESKFPISVNVPAFAKLYLLNSGAIYALRADLATYSSSSTYDEQAFKAYGQNPIDCICSLKLFPFTYDQLSGSFYIQSEDIKIVIGNWRTETDAKSIELKTPGNYSTIFDGSETIAPYFNDFRDYDPYTTYDLYLPFCGTVKLDGGLLIGNTLRVIYKLDGITGIVLAHILINNYMYMTTTGNCAIDIPLTGLKVADYKQQMLELATQKHIAQMEIVKDVGRMGASVGNAIMAQGINMKHSETKMVKAGAIVSAIGNTIQYGADIAQQGIKIHQYNQLLEHSAPAPAIVNVGGGMEAWGSPMYVQLLIHRPEMLDYSEEVYSKTVGHACCIYDTINSQHEDGKDNFVKVNDVLLDDIDLTETEKRELLSLLQSGVII